MLGSILSIVTVVSLLTYAAIQLQVMYAKEDYRVQLRVEPDYFSSGEPFGPEQGFFIAMTLADINSKAVKLDPSIGELNFYHTLYDYNADQSSSLDAVPFFDG